MAITSFTSSNWSLSCHCLWWFLLTPPSPPPHPPPPQPPPPQTPTISTTTPTTTITTTTTTTNPHHQYHHTHHHQHHHQFHFLLFNFAFLFPSPSSPFVFVPEILLCLVQQSIHSLDSHSRITFLVPKYGDRTASAIPCAHTHTHIYTYIYIYISSVRFNVQNTHSL